MKTAPVLPPVPGKLTCRTLCACYVACPAHPPTQLRCPCLRPAASLPACLQTVINIAVEVASRKSGRVLAVYASTPANSLWRLGASLAGKWGVGRLMPSHGGGNASRA